MAKQWPPKTVNIKDGFKKAHEAKTTTPPSSKIVTAAEVEKLEKQTAKPAPALKPMGAKPNDAAQRERERRIRAMKERLVQNEGKARDDFRRVNER